jgi:hypothetical protein
MGGDIVEVEPRSIIAQRELWSGGVSGPAWVMAAIQLAMPPSPWPVWAMGWAKAAWVKAKNIMEQIKAFRTLDKVATLGN